VLKLEFSAEKITNNYRKFFYQKSLSFQKSLKRFTNNLLKYNTMKNLITLFTFVLLTATVQSQSLSQKDITGTWIVQNVENSNSNPKLAAAMTNAIINLYADNSFEIKEKQAGGTAYSYNTTSHRNATWSYNSSTQTITTTRSKMTFKVSESGDKVFFTDQNSGLKFEVIKPI
jgi:hypothetical protein